MDRIDQYSPLGAVLGTQLFDLGGRPVTVSTIAVVACVLVLGFGASGLASRWLRRELERKGLGPQRSEAPVRLTTMALRALALVAALEVAGVHLSAVLAAGAVFAVGVGLAMQKVAENFVSGVILFLEQSIRVGDVVEVEKRIARVLEIGIRATLVRTIDDEDIIVPNSVLVQSAVKNFTLKDPLYRLRVTVGVAYSSDLAVVRRTLEQAASRVEWRVKSREPIVLLAGFGASSVDYEVSVWTDDAWSQRVGMSRLREAIWDAFQKEKITIAFPQMDIHLDAPVSAALAALGRAA